MPSSSLFDWPARAVTQVLSLLVLWMSLNAAAWAATVPTGFQEYQITGDEEQIWTMLENVADLVDDGTDNGSSDITNAMDSIITVTVSADEQVVVFDHWEDGYVTGLIDPTHANYLTSVDGTTLILGDQNPANGAACDFVAGITCVGGGGAADDLLSQGDTLTLASTLGDPSTSCLAADPVYPPGGTGGTNLLGCVPVPRVSTQIRFDGGDYVAGAGGPLTVVHIQDPNGSGGFIAGASEMISAQAVSQATSYSIPVGEDLHGGTGNGTVNEPFRFVYLNFVAFVDNTAVTITSPAAGTVSFTLQRGQHYSTLSGDVVGPGVIPAAPGGLTINAGTKLVTSQPVAGLIFTGGDGNFQTRFYTMIPDLLHGSDYITTAPGDQTGLNGDRPLNLYIFNPDPVNAITVSVTDIGGTFTGIAIPANTQVDFHTATGRFPAGGSTVRLTGDRPFWGISAYTHQSTSSDWGHAWLATKFLSGTYTVSFSPDTDGTDPSDNGVVGGAPVHVSPVNDRTCVSIDFDNDGTPDQIQDPAGAFGDVLAFSGAAGAPCDSGYLVDVLDSLSVTDPTDADNEGTRIDADKPVAVAYGQHTDRAAPAGSLSDYGYIVFPIEQAFLDPVLTMTKTSDVGSVSVNGGTVTYTIEVTSYDFDGLTVLSFTDDLPTGIDGTTDYVAGSSVITYPDLSQQTGASADPITSTATLVWNGAQLTETSLDDNETITITYQMSIPNSVDLPLATVSVLTNEATVRAMLASSTFNASDDASVIRTAVTMAKTVDVTSAELGDTITYNLTVTNPAADGTDESDVQVSDAVPSNTTFVPGSITNDGPFVGTFDSGQNAVIWNIVGATFRDEFSSNAYNNNDGSSNFASNWIETNDDGAATTGDFIVDGGVLSMTSRTTPVGAAMQREADLLAATGSVAYLSFDFSTTTEIDPDDSIVVEISSDGGTNYTVLENFTNLGGGDVGSREYDITAQIAANTRVQFRINDNYGGSNEFFRVDNLEFRVLDELIADGDPHALSFQVTVNAGVAQGTVLTNQGTYQSDETNAFVTNEVQTTVVAPVLDIAKTIVGTPTGVHPNETVTFEISASNSGSASATGVTISDLFPTNATYVSDSMTYRTNANAFAPLTDANDTDEGREFANRVEFDSITLSPGETLDFRFQMTVNAGTDGETLDNYATVGASNLSGADTNLLSTPIAGSETVDGRVYEDANNSGDYTAGEEIAGVTVTVTDLNGNAQVVVTDVSGQYSVLVPAGSTTVDVDENDADLIAAVTDPTLSIGTDPTVVDSTGGATVEFGFVSSDLSLTKTSNGGASVQPGDVITYTLTATNTSGTTQSGLVLDDVVPTNTSFITSSGTNAPPGSVFRVKEYYLDTSAFTGTTHDLTLDYKLAPNYFVIVKGSDGDGTDDNTRGPDENYMSLTADPFGTGDLATSSGSTVLSFTRQNSIDAWVGVVTVVESLGDPAVDGFTLLDVQRVAHTGTALAGTDTTATAWSNINQVLLMGGFNGSGCDTTDATATRHASCHARLFPSSTNTINWSRIGASLQDATSTVMAVEWGSSWGVQHVQVTGTNGGTGANAVGEYATTAITSVVRANTWVWGTGHTPGTGIGNSAEGVLITLGDGVNTNANESTVAAGKDDAGDDMKFEVYVMTHTGLSVSHDFLPIGDNNEGTNEVDGDDGDLTEDMTVTTAGAWRMALAYNGQDGTGIAFPRSLFSARYAGDSTIRLERRRTGQEFPAWVQGIDFSSVTANGGFTPQHLMLPASLAAGASATVTFQVLVDEPLPGGVSTIDNTARLTSFSETIGVVGVASDTIGAAVSVEANGAAVVRDDVATTIDFQHTVTNDGTVDDSFDLTLTSTQGYAVQLIDPSNGAVLATDSNGDGVWDGAVTVNTGALGTGESASYIVRASIPLSAVAGDTDTVTLTATSDRFASVSGMARDEISVSTLPTEAQGIRVTPDSSTVAEVGDTLAFTHFITNNTGSTDIFDLTARTDASTTPIPPVTPVTWTTDIYRDTNGDGVYTAGVDNIVANTVSLDDGDSMTIFVVVNVPSVGDQNEPAAGDIGQVQVTVISQNDPTLAGFATDTITIGDRDLVAGFDLSGGGTQVVNASDIPVFPGKVDNLGSGSDFYEFNIGASDYTVNPNSMDGRDHPTQLYIDTTGDGTPDTLIATDTTGNGVWDTVDPAYDLDGNDEPGVAISAGGTLAYELRRPVAANQNPYRDPVTLTVSSGTGVTQSVTATNTILLSTRAVIGRLVAFGSSDGVTVYWETESEHGTVGFNLERYNPRTRSWVRLNRSLLPGLLHSRTGGAYRFDDSRARVGDTLSYRLVELEATGNRITYGPYTVTVADDALSAGVTDSVESLTLDDRFERVARPLQASQAVRSSQRNERKLAAELARRSRKGAEIKITTSRAGLHRLDASSLAAAFGKSESKVRNDIIRGRLALKNKGQRVATLSADDGLALYFYGEQHDSQYSGNNVYHLSRGIGLHMARLPASPQGGVATGATFRDEVFANGNQYTLTHLFEDPNDDYWMWDFRYESYVFHGCDTNPQPCFQPLLVATPGRDASATADAELTVRLHGGSVTAAQMGHRASVVLNGVSLGTVEWHGIEPVAQTFDVAASILVDGDNVIEITGASSGNPAQPSVFYINDLSIAYDRQLVAAGDQLEVAATGPGRVDVGGFSTPDVLVLEISNPRRPRQMTGTTVSGNGSGYTLAFQVSTAAAKASAVTLAAAIVPESIVADKPSALTWRRYRIDHLTITTGDMVDAAQVLADYRAGQGMRTMVVDIEDIYDEFSFGIPDADAIWSFLHFAHTRWHTGPRYVLLAGEGSVDYRNYLGLGDSLIPTLLTPTPDGLYPSDNLLADLVGNDWVGDVAIGRLPVINATELAGVVDKIIAYEASDGAWTQELTVAADIPDLGGDFTGNSERVLDEVPSNFGVDRLHLEELTLGDARQVLLDGLTDGRAFINFFGHGGVAQLGNNGLLKIADVNALTNIDRLPVITAFTCLAGQFGFQGIDSIGETLVIKPDGGAAAVWSPSGLSQNDRAGLLGQGFYRATFAEGELVIGEVILKAQAHYAKDGRERYLLDIYNLIGDPATVMK